MIMSMLRLKQEHWVNLEQLRLSQEQAKFGTAQT